MAYVANLGDFQLAIANVGQQTQINLTMSRRGQQQSQSHCFTTGKWTSMPRLFNLGQSFILKIDAQRGCYHTLIEQSSITTVDPPLDLDRYPRVHFQERPESTPQPDEFKPMQPMQPLKMGNMSMDINSMSMRMGKMSMNLDQAETTSAKQFCGQCGTQAKPGDRFCRSCGDQLNL